MDNQNVSYQQTMNESYHEPFYESKSIEVVQQARDMWLTNAQYLHVGYCQQPKQSSKCVIHPVYVSINS